METIKQSEINLLEEPTLLELTAKKKTFNINITWFDGCVLMKITFLRFIKLDIDLTQMFKLLFKKHQENR